MCVAVTDRCTCLKLAAPFLKLDEPLTNTPVNNVNPVLI